jgi:hypothetical protein
MRVKSCYYQDKVDKKNNYVSLSEGWIMAVCCKCRASQRLYTVVEQVYLCGLCADLMDGRKLIQVLSQYLRDGDKRKLVINLNNSH